MQHIDERDEHAESWLPFADHSAQSEQDALLVLLDDPDGQGHSEKK